MLKMPKISKSQGVLLASYALILCAELLYILLQMTDRPKLLLMLFGLFAIGMIVSLVMFYLLKMATLKIETVFLICLIVMGICYIAVIGPLKSNDETSHYIGAYWLSDLMLLQDASSLQMRGDDVLFYQKWAETTLDYNGQFPQLFDGFSLTVTDPELIGYADCSSKNLLNSPAQRYFFPALGLSIARLLGLGAVPAYCLGRLLALISFSLVAYVSVRNTPIGKPVFMIIAMLPMTLELSSSFSYDGPAIALGLLLSSFCFKAIYSEKQERSTLIVIGIAVILIVPLKVVYSVIALLILVIPTSSFPSKRFAILYKAGLMAACAITLAITQLGAAVSLATSDTASFSVSDTYEAYSINDVVQHPLWAAHVLLNSFFERLDFKVLTYLGAHMGQVNMSPYCNVCVSIGFLLLILFALIHKDPSKRPALHVIIVSIAGFALCALALEFVMLVGHAERGADVIIGVLGRYFIPVTPLLIPLCLNTGMSRSYPTPKMLMYGAFCLNVFYVVDLYGLIALA